MAELLHEVIEEAARVACSSASSTESVWALDGLLVDVGSLDADSVVVVVLILWLLQVFGVIGGLHGISVR